jgi:hypothetical protein
MNRFDSTLVPDRFELEAAARRNRSEICARAFDAIAHWLDAQIRSLVTHGDRPATMARTSSTQRLAH